MSYSVTFLIAAAAVPTASSSAPEVGDGFTVQSQGLRSASTADDAQVESESESLPFNTCSRPAGTSGTSVLPVEEKK